MAEEQTILHGTVSAVVYQNEENGYAVLRLKTDEGETVTVVGTIPLLAVGERLAVTGKWMRHASYGQQFAADFLERQMPDGADEILAYLSSRAIRGIGPMTAKKLVARFGSQTLEVLEKHPEQLAELPGFSAARAAQINEAFCAQVGLRRLIEFLVGYHLPPELAMRLYQCYGELAVDAVKDDPYLLTEPFFGADFALVDQFALAMGVEADDPRRVEAGVVFELRHNTGNGHVFLPLNKLMAATAQLLGLDETDAAQAVARLTENDRLIAEPLSSLTAVYLPELYEAETQVAQRLRAMADAAPEEPDGLDEALRALPRRTHIDYAPAQLEAIRKAACCQALLLTGGPGTGKTTTLAGILALLDELGQRAMLAAPTGRAAKRLTELTDRPASTIHRLLESQFDPETGAMGFYHNEHEPLDTDVMIVDETSMVDLTLMHALLRALRPGCRLILVGDPDQLPSVGAGNLFSDLLRSERLETVRLTEIFRQARQSLIVMNAHAVNHGQMPVLNDTSRDFFFMKRPPEAVAATVRDLCHHRLPDNMHIPASQIQVLSPTRRGPTGTAHLNEILQESLNPPAPDKPQKQYGGVTFRLGDRVMQIRNNYDLFWRQAGGFGSGTGVFNGDMGVITAMDLREETLCVSFDDDREATYAFDQLGELELAYAMTVHKSQGSEYRAVVMVVSGGSSLLHTRGVLYTAITRARELLVLVGEAQVVANMTANDRQARRYSGLRLRLCAP